MYEPRLNSKNPTNSRYNYNFFHSAPTFYTAHIYIYKGTLSGKTLKHFQKYLFNDLRITWDLGFHWPSASLAIQRQIWIAFHGAIFQGVLGRHLVVVFAVSMALRSKRRTFLDASPPKKCKKKNQVEVRDILIGKELIVIKWFGFTPRKKKTDGNPKINGFYSKG